MQQFDK